MDGFYFIIGLLGLLIWAAILQPIISAGTRTKERIAIEKAQLKLLTAMARKAGVPDEEVQGILMPKKVKEKEGRWW
ncbi:MAG: hypothetical protein ABI863_09870 [Ginsengibacter sp.]